MARIAMATSAKKKKSPRREVLVPLDEATLLVLEGEVAVERSRQLTRREA